MSYQLRRDEKVGEGLRRIARHQVELALATVRGEKEPDDTPVHEIRKHLKKARAILRIVRKEIGRGPFVSQNHCLRDVARMISEIRDAEVRLQTAQQLQSIARRQKRRGYEGIEKILMAELETVLAAFAEWQVQAVPMLERACEAIKDWPIDQFGFKQLRRNIQGTYKRGRRALADTKRIQTAESFHVFRKAAKQLYYQLRILAPSNPVVLKSVNDELKALGELLGRAHDLSFLNARLRREANDDAACQKERTQVIAVIEASQSDLQRSAVDLAERFYAERPRDFGARITGWLEGWCDGESASVADALVSS